MDVDSQTVYRMTQAIHASIDSFSEDFDGETVKKTRDVIDRLLAAKLVNPIDRTRLATLAVRISVLPRIENSSDGSLEQERVFHAACRSFEIKEPLFRQFLVEVNLTMEEAKKIEEVLPKDSRERESVLSAAEPLLSRDADAHKIFSVLRAVAEITPVQERESVCAEAFPFIKKSMEPLEIYRILTALSEIPFEERREVCEEVKPFIREEMTGVTVGAVLRATGEVPQQERASFFNAMIPLIQTVIEYKVRVIFTYTAKVCEEERESFCAAIEPLMRRDIPNYSMGEILKEVIKIPAEERARICLAAAPFIKERLDTKLMVDLFKTLPHVTEEYKDVICKFFEKTTGYENKNIADFLTDALLHKGRSKQYMNALSFLVAGKSNKGEVVHKMLPSIVPAKWLAEAKEAHVSVEKEEPELCAFLNASRAAFRDHLSSFMQIYLLTTSLLDGAEGISPMKKLQLLSAVCRCENCVKGFGFINALCARKETEAFNDISLENPIESLREALEKALVKGRIMDLSGIDRLMDKYSDAFENTRIPLALEVYTAGISKLGDLKAEKTLERFVRSVLLGNFTEERFDTNKSLHLRTIQKYGEETGKNVLGKWKHLVFEARVANENVQLCTGWEDLFLAGSETAKSCQRVDGDPTVNKCLMAYCLDGKNAMMAVKGESGEILARSIVRLLWDKTRSEPVLILEPVYPRDCSKERETAIRKSAKACADRLGLEIFTHRRMEGFLARNSTDSLHVIDSLGSSCPYEYADGSRDGETDGKFSVEDVIRLE